ncbi:hypothetical protein ScPMuIL_007385 [Solemya velum]
MSSPKIPFDIRKYFIFISLIVFVTEVTLGQNCRSGLPQDDTHTVYKGKCYGFNTGSKNWTAAQATCKKQNGELVEIYTEGLQTYLAGRLQKMRQFDKSGLWIGSHAKRNGSNLKWLWASGPGFKYDGLLYRRHIQAGQCLMIRADMENKWVSRGCVEVQWWFGFICQYSSGSGGDLSAGTRQTMLLSLVMFVTAWLLH